MLPASRDRILAQLPDDARVLDVGGWAKPFGRADWVLDLLPYETRGLYGREDDGAERFGADTWVARDICAKEPWPFEDGFFDFAICSHTLEDVRDPVYVCEELQRVARAGYVEVPSRLQEQAYGVQGPWVGWGHHHWLIEPVEDGLEFVFKPHSLHHEELHFPAGFGDTLTAEERVTTLWWEGSFTVSERVFIVRVAEDIGEHTAWLRAPIEARGVQAPPPRRGLRNRLRARRSS